jgi:tetratricopeptide (TPR) repeat protein
VAYNLGTLYHALGEPEVAEAEWNIAAETDSPELLARVAYNYGIHLFESGRFDEAYRSFRTALELNPQDVDTKINLEYTLQKLESQNEGPREMGAPEAEGGETGQEVQMILEYVRRKEEGRWQSTETIDEDFRVQDW